MTPTSPTLHHVAITCVDLASSAAFWEGVFNAVAIPRPSAGVSPHGRWYRIGGLELHLQYREKSMQKTDQHFALETDEADLIARRAQAFGRLVETPESLLGFAKRYYIYDPDDNRVELLGRSTA